MRIENNILVFEVVKCWNCEGKKELKRYNLCPNQNKNRKKICSICSGERYHHNTVGSYTTPCFTCNGTGKLLENECDYVNKDIIDYIVKNGNFACGKPSDIDMDVKFMQSMFTNSFCGWQDYIDHRKDTPEYLLKLIIDDVTGKRHGNYGMLQAINYINKDNSIILNYIYYGYYGGLTCEFVKNNAEVQSNG